MPSNDVCATECRCGAKGERVCDQVDCPRLDCDNPVSVRGQCCPVCGCKSDDGVIEPFGKWILFFFVNDDCEEAFCERCESRSDCTERAV